MDLRKSCYFSKFDWRNREHIICVRTVCKPVFSRSSSKTNFMKIKHYSSMKSSLKKPDYHGQKVSSFHAKSISNDLTLTKIPLEKKTETDFEDERIDFFFRFIRCVRLSNGMKVTKPVSKYRFYVGPGNNASMISRIIRNRWWWVSCDNPSKSHFVWTSLKHKPTLSSLPYSTRSVFIESTDTSEGLIEHTPLQTNEVVSRFARIHNKLARHKQISNKKFLFSNLRSFYNSIGRDVFEVVPLTFHIKGKDDPSMQKFSECFHSMPSKVWIIKPGEKTNRGFGINMSSSLKEIQELVADSSHTYIVQKYIENPLLINNRKFDIRCYALVTSINGVIQGYYYRDGYIRTSGHEYSLEYPYNKLVHLTNDAIQKFSDCYGKFETGNKWSYSELQHYLGKSLKLKKKILPKIKEIIGDTIKATYDILDPERKMHSFEIFGYDFMIDSDHKVWLIEANTNPCLELSSYYLSKMIPSLIENAFRIVLDPLFPPTGHNKQLSNWLNSISLENKFELVFSETDYVNK